MEELEQLIQRFISEELINDIKKLAVSNKVSLLIDFQRIDQFSPELGDAFLKKPDETIESLKIFIREIEPSYKDLKFNVRIRNLPENAQLMINEIRSKHLGRLIQTTGLIKLATTVRPFAKSISFECQNCGHITKVEQTEGAIKTPLICSNCGRKGRFKIVDKELIDTQRIVLEEAPEDLEGGQQPKQITVILKDDLVDPKFEKNIIPGNKVTVSGVIVEVPVILQSGKRSVTSELRIEASYIESVEQSFEELSISKEEEDKILELSKDKLIYQKLKDSIAPNIFGYDHIKEAIVLQLFGGVRKAMKDEASVFRGDIHILLVGDPGTSKSAILRYVSTIAPKARYVTGMGSSAAGLTATVTKDEASKTFVLEAGAMPLTNGGLLVIDELDKMNKDDRAALHSALEQQIISISKANIHATLISQTSVLAAANPKLGRFNPYDVVATQIDLPPTLINRFDLIFIMADKPNPDIDKMIAQKILEANKDIEKNKPAIETDLLRKYIAYARQKVKPVLSEEAMKIINDFYIKLRSSVSNAEDRVKPVPISARQLEAVIRLSEASAKVRLSNYVLEEDARRAIDLIMAYLGEVGVDKSTGELDIDRIAVGISTSQRSTVISVKSIISKEINSLPAGSAVQISQIYDDAEKIGISRDQVDNAISILKKEGEIFEPRMGYIKSLV